ncbi:MAG TPA: protein kinase [Candidatus Acidoferrum sp.]|nr:protein kinase [Candidatus Acidoferrum sp.]
MVGKTFAHYVVLEKAGAGGMGVVFRARDETLHRDVALKLPSTNNLTDAESRERVLREARAASALNHPHICTIYEVGEVNGQPYIAMEYLAGETLSRRIPSNGLSTESVLDLGAQVADAMDHAHTQGILHRDLKSANVRMTSSGQLKVLDFGLAMNIKEASLEGVTRSTSLDSGGVAGTLAYMAPELLQGKVPDTRTDIWSLGVLLYEMAAGALPFQGRTGFELTTAILRESPASLPTHVTPGLRAVITHCLSKEPEKRYQHASEIRAALEALQSDTGVAPHVAGAEPQSKSRAWYVLAAAGALAAAAVVLLVYGRFNKPSGGMQNGGKLRLFLSTEGNLSGPALSPDGKMLAYVQGGDGKQDLYVSRLAGGEHLRLTNDGTEKNDPQFSPDGEKIVFDRLNARSNQPELCVIPALGGNVVSLLPWAENPAWSPDGGRLAFIVRKPGDTELLVASAADGSEPRIILKGDDVYPFFGRVTWSPDSKMIAASRSRGGMNREIWTIPAQGGEPTRLTKDLPGVVSDSPVFTPDGRAVVHRSNRGGASNIWWQPLDANSPVQLTSGPGPDTYPSIARNGTIAFLNSRSRFSLVLYSPPEGTPNVLLTDSSRLWAPAFSPDGKEIVYSRDEPDGLWHLWLVPTEQGPARQITSGKTPEIYPRFAPDGATIFFNTWGAEPLSIWRVSSQGGPARPATTAAAGSDAYGDVSPDGRSIVFTRTENKISHLYIALADGTGVPRRVIETPGTVPRWSPNGEWLSFSPNRSFSSGVFIVHPDGTGLRQLTKTGGWAVWWPDGEHIGFQVPGPDANQQIQVYSLKSGEARTLSNIHFVGTNFPFDVSRDGKRLVTTNYQHLSDEIWLLEPAEKK